MRGFSRLKLSLGKKPKIMSFRMVFLQIVANRLLKMPMFYDNRFRGGGGGGGDKYIGMVYSACCSEKFPEKLKLSGTMALKTTNSF